MIDGAAQVIVTLAALLSLAGLIWVLAWLIGSRPKTPGAGRSRRRPRAKPAKHRSQAVSLPDPPRLKHDPTVPIFDIDGWKPLFWETDTMVTDLKGNFYLHMYDNVFMDMKTGELRWTNMWPDETGH